jgi:hypothetical protein
MTDKLLNIEYGLNPSNRSDIGEAHIHTYTDTYIPTYRWNSKQTIFSIQGCSNRYNSSESRNIFSSRSQCTFSSLRTWRSKMQRSCPCSASCGVWVGYSGTERIPSFVKIGRLVQKLKGGGHRYTHMPWAHLSSFNTGDPLATKDWRWTAAR